MRITDTEENPEKRKYRGDRRNPSPTVRSFASFMLQHQNLIANKHAVFYRFDEQEKREQAIDHFKIFMGFADQAYFLKSQDLHALQAEQRRVELQIPRMVDVRKKAVEELQRILNEYSAISGVALDIGTVEDAVRNPMRTLESLRQANVALVPLSDEHAVQRQAYEKERGKILADLRKCQQRLMAIQSSISFAKSYVQAAVSVRTPAETQLSASNCPFCKTSYPTVEREANRLEDAIEWLNMELRQSPYLLESFEEEEHKTKNRIAELRQAVHAVEDGIAAIDKQTADLEKHRTQYELALKTKLQAEAVLEQMMNQRDQQLEKRLAELKEQVAALKDYLEAHYDIQTKLKQAENAITQIMSKLGPRFEFEDSYRPIDLRFSLATFDLWHQSPNGKVFLRSMGSGANWLYCHLTLFLALQRYFCSLGDVCSIPTILFLDQPSQVYFPSVLDSGTEFVPKELAALEGKDRKRSADEDIRAVTNLYSQLVRFCKETVEETGIEPQIIVTDHADNLVLDDGQQFDSLVQGRRWRTRGFIDPIPDQQDT